MNRRRFLSLAALSALLPALPAPARADGHLHYTPDVLRSHLAAGEVVLLSFRAEWENTCQQQARIIDRLRAENPAYAHAVTLIDVDWDIWGESRLASRLNVPRRSTLLVLKGDHEVDRLIASTEEAEIRALLDAALAAATAA